MSHLNELSELKRDCAATGRCEAFEIRLQQERQIIDHKTADLNQTAIIWGLFIAILGVYVLLTPFNTLIKRIQKAVLPLLAIVVPVLIGIALGASIGFWISFDACFKQTCSSFESSATLILALASLLISIPLAVVIYRKRALLVKFIDEMSKWVWLIIGMLVILFAAMSTYSAIYDNMWSNTRQKSQLEVF